MKYTLTRFSQQWMAKWWLWDSGPTVRNWHPSQDIICPELVFTLQSVHGDMLSCLRQTKWSLYTNSRAKQPSGGSYLYRINSQLSTMFGTTHLVPVRFDIRAEWLATAVGDELLSLRSCGPRSETGIQLVKYSLRIDIYPGLSARRHVIMSPLYKLYIYHALTVD